jgi:excisionase family DNA binding protein
MATGAALTLSPHEAAARLGLGRGTVYRLLKAGRLPAVRVGKRPHYRIPVRALEEVLADPERLTLGTEEEATR